MPIQPTASSAARSVGCVIIASWGASKSTTSQPAVSRSRTAKPEKLGVSGPWVQRTYWRGSGGDDGSGQRLGPGRSGWPRQAIRRASRRRSGDPEELGRRRRDQAVDHGLLVDLAPLGPQQVEHRLAVLGDERVQVHQPRDPRVGAGRRAGDDQPARRSGRPARPRAGRRSTESPASSSTCDRQSRRARRAPRRSARPDDVGASTSCPAALSSAATSRQHQPPCHAPWTSTNVAMARARAAGTPSTGTTCGAAARRPGFSIAARCSGVE